MPDNRCFRVDEFDIEELRDRRCDNDTIQAYENWVRDFSPRVDDVVSQLTDAFAGTELGAGIGLWEAQGLDDYASAEELKNLRSKDENQDWRKIPIEHLNCCHAAPSFMDARGFVFHLPAFLIAKLNDQHGYGFLDRLSRQEEHPPGWSDMLTRQQKNAVVAALKLIQAHPDYERDRNAIGLKIAQLSATEEMG